ncbi:MAG: AzlC family ABC transporter permease [Burkholderiaceae bacterium]
MNGLLKHPMFRSGVHDMVVVAAGIAAWGVMTGVAMVKSGMGTVDVLLMGVLVFAGSSQLAAIPLIATGAPIWVVLAAAFCVNLRFVVFSAHLRPYVMHRPLVQRMAMGYLMADINYVLFTKRFHVPASDQAGCERQDAYWLGLGLTAWISWVVPSLVGIVLGNSVPLSWGLGFAGILALLGIACSLVSTPLRLVSAGVAGAAAVAAYALPLKLNIVVAIAAAVAACLLLEAPGLARRRTTVVQGDRS